MQASDEGRVFGLADGDAGMVSNEEGEEDLQLGGGGGRVFACETSVNGLPEVKLKLGIIVVVGKYVR